MPSKKQRRRRTKARRHEYEYVYVDEEGNEVEVDPAELEAKEPKKTERTEPRRDSAQKGKPARSRRPVEPPSLRRVFRRALFIGPLMFVVIWLTSKDTLTTAEQVQQTLFLMILFLPFSYLVDRIIYRAYRRRVGDAPDSSGRAR